MSQVVSEKTAEQLNEMIFYLQVVSDKTHEQLNKMILIC